MNFATGENHVSLPQADDNMCATCHTVKGELEFDASIKGAHTVANRSATLAGLVLQHPEDYQHSSGPGAHRHVPGDR